MKTMNIYLLIVLANVCLTFGNAVQGKKLAHLSPASIAVLIFGAKFAVGIYVYAFHRDISLTQIPWKEIVLAIGIGVLLGFGELFLFGGLARNTSLVSALGCLYPILLAAFAFCLSGEPPKPMMAGAIILSGAAIYMAYLSSS